jgi:hypothetical protein
MRIRGRRVLLHGRLERRLRDEHDDSLDAPRLLTATATRAPGASLMYVAFLVSLTQIKALRRTLRQFTFMEAAMTMVAIKCPEMSHTVLTGIEVDGGLGSLPDVPYETDCPLCGDKHVWWKKSAWLAEPPRRRRDVMATSRILKDGAPLTVLSQPRFNFAATADGYITFVIQNEDGNALTLRIDDKEADEMIQDLRNARRQLTIQDE